MVESIQNTDAWNSALVRVNKIFRLEDYVANSQASESRSVIDDQRIALAVSLILTGLTAAAIIAYRKLHSLHQDKNS